MRWRSVVCAIAVMILFMTNLPRAEASDAVVALFETSSTLELSGRAGDPINGTFALISKAPVRNVLVYKRPLLDATTKQIIPPNQISLPADSVLVAGVPRSFTVTITARRPGTYEGILDIYAGGAHAVALKIRLLVRASVTAIQAVSSTPKYVQANSIANKWLTENLLPTSADAARAPLLKLLNPNGAALTVRNVQIHATGATGRLLDPALVTPIMPAAGSTDRQVILFVAADVAKIAPDRYAGAATITCDDCEGTVTTPIEIDVRAPPLLPLVLIISGILIGWLLRFMDTKGTRQISLLRRVEQAKWDLSLTDLAIVEPMLDRVEILIERVQLDEAEAELRSVLDRIRILKTLDELEKELSPHAAAGDVRKVLDSIAAARQQIRMKLDAAAAEALREINSAVANLPVTRAFDAFRSSALSEQLYTYSAARVTPPAARVVRRSMGDWLRRLRLGVLRSFVSPLMYLALLAGLTFIGFYGLYIQNPAFGSNSFSDYIALLLWAVSADVASKSLSGLRGMAPR